MATSKKVFFVYRFATLAHGFCDTRIPSTSLTCFHFVFACSLRFRHAYRLCVYNRVLRAKRAAVTILRLRRAVVYGRKGRGGQACGAGRVPPSSVSRWGVVLGRDCKSLLSFSSCFKRSSSL